MSLNDQQLMLLEQLTYMNDDVLRSAGLDENTMLKAPSVSFIINRFSEENLETLRGDTRSGAPILNESGNSTHVTGEEWAAIITAIKDDPELMNMEIKYTTSVQDDTAGYNIDAMTFVPKNSNEGAVVCFRGTLNGEEWKDDAEYLGAIETDCNQKALLYINSLPYSDITVVGHSKGANKAAYTYFESDKVSYCLAMDCPGVSPEYYTGRQDIINNKQGTIKCYSLESDFVNILLMPIPTANYIYCKGSGVADFAENHCPNCFFYQYEDPDKKYLKIGNVLEGKPSDSMKMLNGFTCFVAIEMPYGDRVNLSSYIGDILETALKKCDFDNDPEGSKKMIIDVVLSDEKKLATTLAYLVKYCELYDVSANDLEGLLKDVGADFAFDQTVLSIFLMNIKDGKDDPALMWIAYEKKIKGQGIDKATFYRLWREVEAEYFALGDIEVKPNLSYESYENRLYNYTQDAYDKLTSAIKGFQDLEYENTSIFNSYTGEEWYAWVAADVAKTALDKYYSDLPTLNDNAKTEVEKVFRAQWEVDDHYYNVMASYLRSFSDFRKKVVDLRDRLAFK